MAGRHYSVEQTDPSNNTNFGYVGKRTTGTEAGGYLIGGPGWTGSVPPGMTRIASPGNSVRALGRTLVVSDADLSAAYALSNQIQSDAARRLTSLRTDLRGRAHRLSV